jgi:trigger factor
MQLTIEDISPVEKRVDFEVPWGDVEPRLDRAYGNLRREVSLKGFRPGKAPRPVLERLFRQKIEDEVAREIIEASLGQAIQEKQIQPVAPPRVDKLELKEGEPFRFSAVVEVRSDVAPKDYAGVALKRRPPQVTEDQIAEAIEGHRKQLTQFIPITGRTTTVAGDLVMVEVTGRVGPHKLKRRTTMVDLAEGAQEPLPGLARRLVGVAMDAQDLEIKYTTAPEERLRELAGQDVALKVNVKEARERRVPALDDELAKDTGEAETLAGLREKIRARLEETERQRIAAELKRDIVKQIVAKNPFPIAPSLVERHGRALIERLKMELSMAGLDLSDGGGLDEERMARELRPQAEEDARASVLLAAIAEREGIQVSDADLQKRIAELAAARQENAKKLRSELEGAGRLPLVRRQIADEKTLDMLLAQAKITDEDPNRLILTPDEARSEGGKLIVTPEEAAAEAEARSRK